METKIMAIVTTEKDRVAGGAPIFVASSREELQKTAVLLEKILDAMVHHLNDETLIVVRHH
jgi:hypothetical protein